MSENEDSPADGVVFENPQPDQYKDNSNKVLVQNTKNIE